MLIFNAALTHAVSQLTYRWIPLETVSPARLVENFSVFDMTLENWSLFIRTSMRNPKNRFLWKKVFAKEFEQRVSILAEAVYNHLSRLRDIGGSYITFYDKNYPDSLKNIEDYPAAFSVVGTEKNLLQARAGIVGSRKASLHATRETIKLSTWLVDRGYVVVSGGAFGCDIVAHRAALESGVCPTPTVVVTASGFEHLFRSSKSRLFSELRYRGGTFVSERLFWMPSRPQDFLVRNRLITGLSQEVFIMQAGSRSGTINLASLALKQGRDLAVLLHPEKDIRAAGSARLIDNGAFSFSSAEEFFVIQDRLCQM